MSAALSQVRRSTRSSMPGEFNVYNALAAIAAAKRMKLGDHAIAEALAKAKGSAADLRS